MRDLIVSQNSTLDGVLEMTGDWFQPTGGGVDRSDEVETIRRHRRTADPFLGGRVTLEQMRGFWPQQVDDTTGIRDHLDDVSKYVVSTTLQDPAWEHSSVLSGTVLLRYRHA